MNRASPKDNEKKMTTDYTDYTDFFCFFSVSSVSSVAKLISKQFIMMPRPHPETNENQHKRTAQHIGSPCHGVRSI
jgi:hypothetical protein